MNLPRYKQILLLSVSFFAVMMLVALFHEEGILKVFTWQEDLAAMRASTEDLKEENRGLRTQIDRLKTDPLAIEKIAREKLNLARPGETIYHIVPRTGAEPTAIDSSFPAENPIF